MVIDTVPSRQDRLDTIGTRIAIRCPSSVSRPVSVTEKPPGGSGHPKTFTKWNPRAPSPEDRMEMMEYSCEENNKSLWEGRIKVPKYRQ